MVLPFLTQTALGLPKAGGGGGGTIKLHQCSPIILHRFFRFTGRHPNSIHASHIHEYGNLSQGRRSL